MNSCDSRWSRRVHPPVWEEVDGFGYCIRCGREMVAKSGESWLEAVMVSKILELEGSPETKYLCRDCMIPFRNELDALIRQNMSSHEITQRTRELNDQDTT